MGQLRLRFAQNNKTVGVTVDYIKSINPRISASLCKMI